MNVSIFHWQRFLDLEMEIFLLLMILSGITNGKENSMNNIECEEANVTYWHWNDWNKVPVHEIVSIKCTVQCSPKCTCTIDDAEVIRNCTSGKITVSPVIYLSNNISYLEWDNSVLHDIKPGAFLSIGGMLASLHLVNVNLQHLQPGVFAGLTSLTHLDVSRNDLPEIKSVCLQG